MTVRAGADGGQQLSVRDNGPGIPKEELPRVMQAFGQGSLAHTSAEGGSGLGLPIVKSLIDLHGGTFELKSELRKGTEAIVTLPRERVLTAMEPLPLARAELRAPPANRATAIRAAKPRPPRQPAARRPAPSPPSARGSLQNLVIRPRSRDGGSARYCRGRCRCRSERSAGGIAVPADLPDRSRNRTVRRLPALAL